jgi:hypothetical protein
VKFRLPLNKNTNSKINPIAISYEIIWAEERRAPKNEYFVLLDQPEQITP